MTNLEIFEIALGVTCAFGALYALGLHRYYSGKSPYSPFNEKSLKNGKSLK